MDTKIGLIIQFAGVFLIAILTIFLRSSIKLAALKYWAAAWLSLSFALVALRLAYGYEQYSDSIFSLYFLGEYVFGLMLVAGCRSLADRSAIKPFSETLVIPLALVSVGLPIIAETEGAFAIHSLVMSVFFAAAFLALRSSRFRTFGWKVTHIALAFLALYSFSNFAASTASAFLNIPDYLIEYRSIFALVLQTALGFGMVIVLLEKVLAESQITYKELETLVHTDPLTEAFNRHAFYGFVKKRGEKPDSTSGCVGFFDIDDLKGINDRFGHHAGDQAIRAVVRAIREIIRAEDLIYRWGGDEFFVIMVSMDAEMADARMARLEGILSEVRLEGVPEPQCIPVSYGFTNFKDSTKLEAAIQTADLEMYRRKEARKALNKNDVMHIPEPAEPRPELNA